MFAFFVCFFLGGWGFFSENAKFLTLLILTGQLNTAKFNSETFNKYMIKKLSIKLSDRSEDNLKIMFVCCLPTQNFQAQSVGRKTFFFALCPRKVCYFKA